MNILENNKKPNGLLRVKATAPTRIDLAGGTLDLWPIHCSLEKKATVNIAIDLDASITIEENPNGQFVFNSLDLGLKQTGTFHDLSQSKKLPLFGLLLSCYWSEDLPAITIQSLARSPTGAGLGGSSCLAVTMGKALWEAAYILSQRKGHSRNERENTAPLHESKLVQISQDIESKLIAAPTGCQDYWGAVRGNINIIRFPFGGVEVQTMASETFGEAMNQRMIVCYSGKSRASAINNWEIYKKFYDGHSQTIQNFEQIGAIAEKCAAALTVSNITEALDYSHEEWNLRKNIWPKIETSETKRIDLAAKSAGATFSRVCGAGGGGVMAIFAAPEDVNKIKQSVIKVGGQILDASISSTGLRCETNSPNKI